MLTIDYSGKTILVTGGTKGVGKGIAEAFLETGATVVICARSAPETLPKINDNSAIFKELDVCDAAAVTEVVDAIAKEFGQLNFLVNNAGGSPHADSATASPRFSERVLTLNLLAPLFVAQAVNRIMQKQDEGGLIINISSVSALRPSPGTAIYGAAKAGLLNLTRSLAVEWAPKVRVNAIVVGLVKTEMAHMHYGDEDGIAAVEKTVPLQRMAVPADVGACCVMLASPRCAYMSGSALTLDGGGETPAFLSRSNANN